jgi:hypothetical protein
VRAGSGAVAVLMLAGLLAGGAARAQDSRTPASNAQDPAVQNSKPQDSQAPRAPDAESQASAADVCEVPSYLLSTESSLARVAEAVKTRQRLDILVVGSGSSALAGPEGASTSYPARLEAALREKLSGITVNVSTDLQIKKTAADVADGLEKLAKDRKPTLVVWQTGTVDALRSVDPDDFRAAIDDGVKALSAAGTDVLLMNLQYSPRMETMISVAPYLDNMRVGAQEGNVPLFDRFAMMRHWNESGNFDLFNPSHGFGLAKRVHECIGRALATFVMNAAHLDTAELRIQH